MARTVILGRSGVGKSWYLGYYLEQAVPEFNTAIHYDIEDEERGLSRKGEAMFKSLYVDRDFLENLNIPKVIGNNLKVRVVPDGLTKEEQQELAAILARTAMKLGDAAENCHFSADEAHLVAPSGSISEAMSRLVTGGRKKGVEYCFSTQRAQNLHEDVLTQTSHGVYFQVTKDSDLHKIHQSCGFSAFDVLPELGERKAILENYNTGEQTDLNTEELSRNHPHVAGDDGIVDDLLAV